MYKRLKCICSISYYGIERIKMNRIIEKTYSYSKSAFMVAILFGLIAGAAMALEPTVSHKAIGIAAWTIALVVAFLATTEKTVTWTNGSWAKIRGGETGLQVRFFINVIAAVVLFVMTVVALSIH